MKIGILTLPIKTNYGGILQAYALVRFLRILGYDAWYIKRRWNNEKQGFVHIILKWFYHHLVIWKFDKFISQYIVPQTKVVDSREKVAMLDYEHFDGYIVGSDQVWRIRNVRGVDYNYFLDFTVGKSVKRIAYAASFGVDYWDDDCNLCKSIAEIKPLIQNFDGVSVREDSGIALCNSLFGVSALHVLDPSLLLWKEDYISNFDLIKSHKEKFIAAYILDMTEDKRRILNHLSDYLQMPIVHINRSRLSKIADRIGILGEYFKPNVKSWLTAMNEASFVVTDSFHGLAFSINFEKQFLAIGNKERGLTRFTSLLGLFGLENRLVLKSEELKSMDIHDSFIDYDKIRVVRQKQIDKSTEFLKDNLQ